jgi:hypothetical protein
VGAKLNIDQWRQELDRSHPVIAVEYAAALPDKERAAHPAAELQHHRCQVADMVSVVLWYIVEPICAVIGGPMIKADCGADQVIRNRDRAGRRAIVGMQIHIIRDTKLAHRL